VRLAQTYRHSVDGLGDHSVIVINDAQRPTRRSAANVLSCRDGRAFLPGEPSVTGQERTPIAADEVAAVKPETTLRGAAVDSFQSRATRGWERPGSIGTAICFEAR